MHSNDVGAFQHRGCDRGERTVEAGFGGSGRTTFVGEEAADEGFAGGADQEGVVGEGGDKLIEICDEFDVLFLTLSEPDSRIGRD